MNQFSEFHNIKQFYKRKPMLTVEEIQLKLSVSNVYWAQNF